MKIVVWLALCLIWGSTWFFIKLGLNENLSPLTFAAARFLIACAIVFIILKSWKIPLPEKKDWKILALTGFLQFTLNYSLVFWSEKYISSGLAAVLQATIPAFGLVAAWIHLKDETIGWRKISAIALGIVGVAIIFIDQLQINSLISFAGCVAIVCGAAFAAEASILTKADGGSLHPLSLVFGQMLCGILPIILAALLWEGNPLRLNWNWISVGSVVYLAIVGTIIAFGLYYWLLRRIDSSKAMTISLVTPLIAVIIGSLALGENLPLQTYLGGALIIGSVGIIVYRAKKSSDMAQPVEG